MFHHHHVHGLGHALSIPTSWKICWSLHLNYRRPVFRLLNGLYVKISLEFFCLQFVERDVSIEMWILEFYYLDLKC
jgi:hypothetical protein